MPSLLESALDKRGSTADQQLALPPPDADPRAYAPFPSVPRAALRAAPVYTCPSAHYCPRPIPGGGPPGIPGGGMPRP